MPLVAHSRLPTFHRLHAEGEEVLDLDRARAQNIRELHIGFLNMMPDAAFEATERQFLRLVGACNRIVQFFVHPFTLPGIDRGPAIRAHIDAHYEPFADLARDGLDALIITGANVPAGSFETAPFWRDLCRVLEFASREVTSTLCACLATHAALHHLHGVGRRRQPRKQWGVFEHRPVEPRHPLVRGVNTRFDVPHSRHNDISRDRMHAAGVRVLVHSDDAGVHLAVSPDLVRFVFFQGHPEYDRNSLLKEHKREVGAYLRGDRPDYPPVPERYLSDDGRRLARRFEADVGDSRDPAMIDRYPEAELLACVDNTWGDTARAIFNSWLGLVYQLTGYDRGVAFMPHVDPEDPLSLRAALATPPHATPRAAFEAAP